MTDDEIKALFGKSEHGNYEAVTQMGVPHPYVITPKHIAYASDHCGGMLGEDAIVRSERAGAKCGMRGCTLKFKEHEQALLVHCYGPLKGDDGNVMPELHQYLLSIKDEATKHNYAGFAFADKLGQAKAALEAHSNGG